MIKAFRAAAIVARTFGAAGLRRRLTHEVRKATGAFRAAPESVAQAAGDPGAVYAPHGAWTTVPADRQQAITARGRRVAAGEYQAFGHEWRPLPARAEDWRRDAVRGFTFPDEAWWRVPDLPQGADIKQAWEPGRFQWAYDLIRAYALTGDRSLADAFHGRLRAWSEASPPFRGPQWSCGQETAIRALAILHAEAALPPASRDAAASSAAMARTLAASGERIADAIGYALSQRNNHGISEAAGLIHLGIRLREAHPAAARWLRLGQIYLAEQIADQFAADGWHSQHSFTYLRVAVEQALLAQRALAAAGGTLPAACLDRIGRALDLITAVIAGSTGVVPNHGANDGGRAVVYSTAAYRDFRPLLTLGALVLGRPLPSDVPADPETVAWLGQGAPAIAPARGDGIVQGASGWAAARTGGAAVFLRAGTYTHRPSHLDPLHLDVRFDDREVIVDAGTYAYNAPPPWKNSLTSAFVHNGPVVDDAEPAVRGPRFLWYSWPEAAIVRAGQEGGALAIVAERPGQVRREVAIAPDSVTIVDRVLDPTAQSIQITWLLHPERPASHLAGADLTIDAREGAIDGWFAPTYGCRLPALACRVRREGPAARQPVTTIVSRQPASA